MRAINPLQLMACGILFALVAAILLFILALSTRTAAPESPNGLSARTAAVEMLNAQIRR